MDVYELLVLFTLTFSHREPFVFVTQEILSSKEENKPLMLILNSLEELIDFKIVSINGYCI